MRQTAIDFVTSGRLSLEGVLTTPEGLSRAGAVVVCHPHPMLGGKMDHPLVTAICNAAQQEGIASLRFNFRGVGSSDGTFGNGHSAQDDLKAAFDFLKHLPAIDSKRRALVGYSFGASVVLGGFKRCRAALGLALISPPVSAVRNSPALHEKRPKLFVVGQRDRVVPSPELQRVLDEVRPPVHFTEIPDADHSLRGRESEVADRVTQFLLSTFNDR